MGLFLGAVLSLVVLGVVLLVIDVNMTHTRRIESQVARQTAHIRRKTLKGWSADQIAERYPEMSVDQIRRVRREMDRRIQTDQEIRLLHTLWSMKVAEAEYEG
jgi:hypothetical protein